MDFYHAYLLGKYLDYIDFAVRNSWPVTRRSGVGIHLALKDILFNLETNKIGENIQKTISDWIRITGEYNYDDPLTQDHMFDLQHDVVIWDDRIKNEMVATPAICLYTKGILNYQRLQGGTKDFFKEEKRKRLSDTAREDLNDAAKCLLCELPTPSVMISLRAMEEVLRQYYKYKTKKHHKRKGWKDILNELLSTDTADIRKYNVNKTLMYLLDYIRENERNVAEHPDKRFDQEEAERVFSEVVKTIIEIYKDMPEAEKDAVEETENYVEE